MKMCVRRAPLATGPADWPLPLWGPHCSFLALPRTRYKDELLQGVKIPLDIQLHRAWTPDLSIYTSNV